MFVHGKTGKKYYSVREKINYYKKVIAGKVPEAPAETKRKAKLRLKTLEKINTQSYDDPRLIVTDDKRFGNHISKARLCVAIKEDQKGRIMVAPLYRRTSRTIILDRNIDRQISNTSDGRIRWIDRSDVYEQKLVDQKMSLTVYDKRKIGSVFTRK